MGDDLLKKAELLAKVAPKTYRATDAGLAFLRDHTGEIRNADLLKIQTFLEFAVGTRDTMQTGVEPKVDDAKTL